MIRLICKKIIEYAEYYLKADEIIPELELKYFNVPGIAECIRMVLNYKDIPFEDRRMNKEKINQIKPSLLFGQVPQLIVDDDEEIHQSKAILRYVGRLGHMYPSKQPLHAAFIDQWIELHSEFMFPLSMNMYPEHVGLQWNENEKKEHRTWCIETHIPKYLDFLENEVENCQFLGGMDNPSIADFCWLPTLQWLTSSKFEGLSPDILDDFSSLKYYKLNLEYILENSDSEA